MHRTSSLAALALTLAACSGTAMTSAGVDGGSGSGSGNGSGAALADTYARACTSAFACLGAGISGASVDRCTKKIADRDGIVSMYRPDQVACLAAAGGDCVAARACIGISITRETCAQPAESCTGAMNYSCADGIASRTDCAHSYYPATAACVASSAPTCGLGACDLADQCDGSRVLRCQAGELEETDDCADFGATCAVGSGVAQCVGVASTCTPATERCEGTVLGSCGIDGHELRFDCATLGATCVEPNPGAAQCSFGTDCTVVAATCTGTTQLACVLGKQTQVDCTAAGFGGCTNGLCTPTQFP